MGWIKSWLSALKAPDTDQTRLGDNVTEDRSEVLTRLRSRASEQRSRLSRSTLEERLQALRAKGAPLRQKDLARERERLARRQQRARNAA